MFEGKEVDGKVGTYGNYFVDVKDNADIEIGLSLKINLVTEMQKLANKKNIGWLSTTAGWLKTMLGTGVEPTEVKPMLAPEPDKEPEPPAA